MVVASSARKCSILRRAIVLSMAAPNEIPPRPRYQIYNQIFAVQHPCCTRAFPPHQFRLTFSSRLPFELLRRTSRYALMQLEISFVSPPHPKGAFDLKQLYSAAIG